MLQICSLKTEYLHQPLGIDAKHPRLSWKLKSNRNGVMQQAYRVTATSDGRLIWDSGVVESQNSVNVRYQGEMLHSRQRVFWKVWVQISDEYNQKEDALSEEACFEMGLLHASDWVADWIEPENEVAKEERKPAPYLRKCFQVRPHLVSARIYQTAHGLYEFWLNGKKGTEDCFKPGLTSYYARIQYQVYDVTELLKEGENVWAVVLGDGWWRGVTGGTVKNNFGYQLHYLGQIELNYADGTMDIIKTDESFRTTVGGLMASDMIMGDIYDASKEPEGWKKIEYNDSIWNYVHTTTEHSSASKIASRSVPVRKKESFIPIEFRDKDGRRVLDFGQNIAGFVQMTLRNCKAGQEIHLVHGEDIDADGNFSVANINQTAITLEAFQEVTYISRGDGEETYCPMFAIFGFRYVMLEGYEGEILPGDFVAYAVYSDMEETGDFTCSNPLINQLVKNSRWSQKGNYMDVPVDCPTRERNAWTGDAQIYVRTATNFMNTYSFYEKWLQDQTIEQYASGKVGITFPSTSSVHNPIELEKVKQKNPLAALAGPTGDGSIGEDCAGWGDAAVWIPYMIYLCYGDKQILENQYSTAKKWVEYMLACAKEHNPLYKEQPQYHNDTEGELDAHYIYDTRMHYGEWQEPIPKEKTEETLAEIFMRMVKEGKPLVATAYLARSTANVAHMAEILGIEADASKYKGLARKIRTMYEKYLIAEDGTIEPGHQAAYVRALAMGLCEGKKKEKVLEQLIKEIEKNDYKLNTGFLSTPFLLPVLADNGHVDIAFRILEETENPSWLHAVTLGATTIMESWNAMDIHDSSYNHYSYGAVCEFLFSYVAGIRPEFEHPGYQKFKLEPLVGGSLTNAAAFYESNYGTIRSEWNLQGKNATYRCEIPVNTEAQLYLPDGQRHSLGSGYYEFNFEI